LVFVLGYALYLRAIHGGKAKNDRIDAHKIAALLRGGTMPQAYVYPREMRATRDLMRRCNDLMRQRANCAPAGLVPPATGDRPDSIGFVPLQRLSQPRINRRLPLKRV
jgi:Transposase